MAEALPVVARRPRLPAEAETELAEIASEWLAGRSPATLAAYRSDLETFREFVGALDVDDAAQHLVNHGPGHASRLVRHFRDHLVEAGYSSGTVNRRLAALRSLVSLARSLAPERVPWRLDVRNVKSELRRAVEGPGRDAVAAMLAKALERGDAKGLRDHAILRLAFDLALRRAEIVALDWQDLNLEDGRLRVLRKGRREKVTLVVPRSSLEALAVWIGKRGREPGPLFLSLDRAGKGSGRLTGRAVHQVVKRLGEEAGVGAVWPHGIRHSSATVAMVRGQEAGFGLEEIPQHTGHAGTAMLLRYRDAIRNVQGRLAELVAGTIPSVLPVTDTYEKQPREAENAPERPQNRARRRVAVR